MSFLQTVHLCSPFSSWRERHTTKMLIRNRTIDMLVGSEAQQLVDACCDPHTNSARSASFLIWASKTIPKDLILVCFPRSPFSCLTTIHSLFGFLLRLWEALPCPWCSWLWGSIVHRWQIQRSICISLWILHHIQYGIVTHFWFLYRKKKKSSAVLKQIFIFTHLQQ